MLLLLLMLVPDFTHSKAPGFDAEAVAATRTTSSRSSASAGTSVVTISHVVTMKPDKGTLRQQTLGGRGEGKERR
eukprot:evm.model.NODE_36126_length_19233_cov_20.094889.7